MTDKSTRATAWHEVVRASLKANDVKLIVYVPDRVFTPLIEALHADAYFTTFAARARRKRSASSPAPGWAACAAPC